MIIEGQKEYRESHFNANQVKSGMVGNALMSYTHEGTQPWSWQIHSVNVVREKEGEDQLIVIFERYKRLPEKPKS